MIDEKKNLYVQLANNINLFNWWKKIIIIVQICFSGVIFITVIYFSDILKNSFISSVKYDYQIEFSGNNVNKSEINEFNEFVSKLEEEIDKTGSENILPIYLVKAQTARISASDLSKKYTDILRHKDLYFSTNVDQYKNKICNLKISILACNDKYVENLGINEKDMMDLCDGECILVDNVNIEGRGKIKSGLKTNNEIEIYVRENEKSLKKSFRVKKIYSNLTISFDNNNQIIIIIPLDSFLEQYEEYVSYSVPYCIYFNGDKEIINFARGCEYSYFINIKEQNMMVDRFRNIMIMIMSVVAFTTVLVMILNIVFILGNRIQDIKKLSNILKVVGVSNENVIKIFLVDMKNIFISSYIIVIIISGCICYYFQKKELTIIDYFKYFYPIKQLGILAFLEIILYIIMVLVFRKTIISEKIMGEIKIENDFLN